ncbi:MAG TPA: hypothetical protein VG694_00570, partial [Candidatus Paceibacterota bacterium]|nr:hypothetical protein [Candidatus Paceibacterota bacterium]
FKKKAAGANPPRALFESALRSVTEKGAERITGEKADVPSPYYKLTFSKFMKKAVYIGVPIVAVLLIAVAVAHRSNKTPEVAMNSQETSSSEAPSAVLPQDKVTKDSSIDSIAASFAADADADASAADQSSEDQELESDLNNYNDLQTYGYENNL